MNTVTTVESGPNNYIATGDLTLPHFCQWLFKNFRKRPRTVVIAHNGGRFDFVFILRYMIENACPPSNIFQSGSKILTMTIEGLKFMIV